MTSLADPISKYTDFTTNKDNNFYRTLRKITPGDAGLSKEQVQKFLKKFKPNIEPEKKTNKETNSNNKDENRVINSQPVSIEKKYNCRVASYTETRNLFKEINLLRKKNYLKERHDRIMDWYYYNRYSVNKEFKESLLFFLDEGIEFTVSNKELYNNFVEYCYDNYMKSHI